MYHAHFGLERGLFGEGIATDAAVFRSAKVDRLIGQFKLALASPSSSIVLRGPAGVGKTTVTSAALRASSTRLALAWLNGLPTNAAELLELLLVELGVSTLRTTRIERLQLWRQFQAEMRATDSRLFIIAERTEDLSHEVLHALDQLTAPDAVGNSGANLILLGHAGLDEHLAAPLLDSLRQRIRLKAELEPFTEAELQDYLRHQVACAGGHYDQIFAPGTVAGLHRYSLGFTRLANTLCESALDIAAVKQHKQLTAELVAKTAVSLLGLAEPVPLAWPAAAPLAAAGALAAEPRSASHPVASAAPPLEAPTHVAVAPTPWRPMGALAAATPRTGAPSALRAAITPPAPPPKPVEVEYDGSATDVADVAGADFPILTDAVEPPAAPPLAKRSASPLVPTAAPAASAVVPPAAIKTVSKPVSRVETAYTASGPALRPPLSPAAREETEPEGALRQTQSMRAISVAKSFDDISEVDAETLFSDAELDLVSAALASAAEWPDDDDVQAPSATSTSKTVPAPASTLKAAPAAPRAKPEAAKAAPPVDDPFDLFGLGDDAPLELIDDSGADAGRPHAQDRCSLRRATADAPAHDSLRDRSRACAFCPSALRIAW